MIFLMAVIFFFNSIVLFHSLIDIVTPSFGILLINLESRPISFTECRHVTKAEYPIGLHKAKLIFLAILTRGPQFML